MVIRSLLSFPNPVNEVAARCTAGGVVLLACLTLILRRPWLLIVLVLGFLARVLSGPKLSPLGLFVTRVLVPRLPLEPKLVAGPPKRFAQGIGAAVTGSAAVLHYGFGRTQAAYGLVVVIAAFATLESVFGLCVGCKIFGVLMQLGLLPPEVCEECNDIWARYGRRL
ncbi:MAG: DUF4395 domain-containing protein [Chloroflexi bacterium]|nr:DUF4395 domain-containing protein [Chloroflexota bacterium]